MTQPTGGDDQQPELSVQVFGNHVRTKGYRVMDLVLIAHLVLAAVSAWMLFEGRSELRELTVGLSTMGTSQRYFACILAVPQEDRWQELRQGGYCDAISRAGARMGPPSAGDAGKGKP